MRVPIPTRDDKVAATSPHSALPSPTSFCTHRRLTKTIVPAGHGHAFPLPRGTRFRIVDLHGEQVVDLFAWVRDSKSSASALPDEKMSMAYTRYHVSGVTPTIGEYLYSNADRPVLRVIADTVKIHDMTFMACFPKLYTDKGLYGHRSCAANVVEAMQKYGMRDVLELPDPFNCFQNTPNYSLKRLGSSKPGDYIEFEACEDVIVAVSCCPYELGGFNGGRITDVAVVVSEEEDGETLQGLERRSGTLY
ncbi:hypothetical protein FB567DRAFT_196528 [Paraphoma chrysanthemicola]|uniref:DUF1989 domain-containing protein n=1 Tax=Paraphoma chrysanthemicola TaxID=798071 RepID=A0A8K0QVA8_9PLEO|nr:hypothetical protein FB567DRAFT_196528 [Paraphoma chrysanthemicola]